MKQYHDLLRDILENGTRQPNRTGIDAISLPGAMLKFNMKDGFPAITTKHLAFKAVVAELIGFLRGYTNAADFRALGCKVWDDNANKNAAWLNNPHREGEDDLGRIYGAQWRAWGTRTVEADSNGFTSLYTIDQIKNALEDVRERPTSRRIIVSAWNPGELDQMALPPCHMMFQLLPNIITGELHMTMYQRSCDMFLGVPFNIASYAVLLHLYSLWSGYKPGTLTMFLADAHIYVNHIDQVKEQLSREEFPLPKLVINHAMGIDGRSLESIIEDLHPYDINLEGYRCHPAIKAPMAI